MCNVPGVCTEDTADTTMCMILNLYRRVHAMAVGMSDGKLYAGPEQIREIAAGGGRCRGDTLGLIGLGRVGAAVAIRAKAFGFSIAVYDPHLADGMDRALGGLRRFQTLQELLANSDCVSLHCPFSVETRHIINETTIRQMRNGIRAIFRLS